MEALRSAYSYAGEHAADLRSTHRFDLRAAMTEDGILQTRREKIRYDPVDSARERWVLVGSVVGAVAFGVLLSIRW